MENNIITYSSGDSIELSPHFNSSEFACQCGKNHDYMIDSKLIDLLEMIHNHFDCRAIIITSGFRCPDHDISVGGTGKGMHTKGMAADFKCLDQDRNPISSKLICCYMQDIGFGGIANITDSYSLVHGDTRDVSNKWYGDEVLGTGTVTSDFYEYYNLNRESNDNSDKNKEYITKDEMISILNDTINKLKG